MENGRGPFLSVSMAVVDLGAMKAQAESATPGHRAIWNNKSSPSLFHALLLSGRRLRSSTEQRFLILQKWLPIGREKGIEPPEARSFRKVKHRSSYHNDPASPSPISEVQAYVQSSAKWNCHVVTSTSSLEDGARADRLSVTVSEERSKHARSSAFSLTQSER